MSESYESIPLERRVAYLQNAQEAIEEAVKPVADPAVEALGELVVKEAESLTETDVQGSQIANEAEDFLSSQESVGDQASKFLENQDRQIKQRVDEITGEKPDRQKAYEMAKEIAEKAGKYDFMSQRREYLPPDALDRADLSGIGFGETKKLMGQIGLQNQLWTEMAEQNQPGSDKPQTPSS